MSTFIRLKLFVALGISKIIIKILRILGRGGTTLPGKIAIKIFPDILNYLADKFKIIMITGTNGKTTTSRIIGQILTENQISFITNKSGANLVSGITTTFIDNLGVRLQSDAKYALLEIDEAAFKKITDYICPDILVVTNFFRDQLDRYGELHSTVNGIKSGIEKCDNVRLILNADDSLCASIGKDSNKEVLYYGFSKEAYSTEQEILNSDAAFCLYCKNRYKYDTNTYGHLGHFYCSECGYSRPDADVEVTKVLNLTSNFSNVEFGSLMGKFSAKINLPGIYNIYNALAGTAFAELMGFSHTLTVKALSNFECGFGRMETIETNNKSIKVILVKNPTGFNQVLNYLLTENDKTKIAFLINDKLADGTDISWLWDVNFEQLTQIQENTESFYVSGTRAEDMAVRLKYSGITTDKIKVLKDYNELIDDALDGLPPGSSFYILPTYTAMLSMRKVLQKKYKLKEFWE